jgi:hypothetical protein
MSIIVVDQGAELFWFVSNALLQDDIPMKHVKTIPMSEELILKELPALVVLNGDDKSLHPDAFIAKMRNHVFARQTMFIVVTSDTTSEYKKALIIAGASQILYRGHHQTPSPKFFRAMVKWFLDVKNPDPQLIDFKTVDFPEHAEFTTFGRVGWITTKKCLLEVNVDLLPGQTIDFHCPLFDELNIKNAKVTVVEKNKVGRYYQYANSLECNLVFSDQFKDVKKLEAWIANNQDVSKPKLVKLLYFEPDADEREKIKKMIKVEKKYCARGFSNLDHFIEDLEFQLPQLVVVNRKLIQQSKAKFEPLAKFLKSHFCYCVTYDPENVTQIDSFKKSYEFALHWQTAIDGSLLDSMVSKLEAKMKPSDDTLEQPKVYFNKYSPYSKISLSSPCSISQIALSGAMIELPFQLSPYCAFEVASSGFSFIDLHRVQYLRNLVSKKTQSSYIHQSILIGQTFADNEVIKKVIQDISENGYEKWKATKN